MNYYVALRIVQDHLRFAYLVKNTSEDPKEIQEALEKIELIETEIIKLAEKLNILEDFGIIPGRKEN